MILTATLGKQLGEFVLQVHVVDMILSQLRQFCFEITMDKWNHAQR